MKIQNLIDVYNELPYPEQRSVLAEIRTQEELDELLARALKGSRVAVRILADLGKRAAKFATAHVQDFETLLKSDDPKKRALTAQLMGNTDPSTFLDALLEGVKEEQTMYVLPEFLVAIGKSRSDKAHEFLKAYKVRSEVDKHIAKEKEALTKALAYFVRRETARVRVLPTDVIACSTPNVDVTLKALRKGGFLPKKFGQYVVLTGLQRFSDIYRVRAYDTAYIYLGGTQVPNLPSFLKSREEAIVQRTQVTGYRIEVNCETHEQRTEIIKGCVKALDKLQNAPSSYSIEILIDVDGEKARVFLNPLTDTRFAYREHTVPASMGCATAACLCAFASSYFNPEARVLDDFCGAGTLLFERGYYPFHTLTGVDISAAAIEAAVENSHTAKVHPQFHHMDALRFTSRRYNEILCNLPFGMRVGSHEQNKKLYDQYFQILPSITTHGATIVLFTHEKKLTEALLAKSEHLELLDKATFNAGGLRPVAYVLRRDDSSYVNDRTDLR